MQTLFWHDYETTGADSRRDRPVQFAGLRTSLDLQPIGEPVMFYGALAGDILPHPDACLITAISPQDAAREGVTESEFAARVHEQLAAPGTCTVGYNSLRFDDEFTRHLLYRNFYDPYAREWEHGNSRWDLIDLARMCHALRPQGITWPQRDDGTPSFRLEHLAQANHLEQEHAHDALSDVHALLDLARLIRLRQPRLWDWYYALRRKQKVYDLLDLVQQTPVVHVSSRYPASRGCLSVIAPLAQHPARPGEIIVYDLGTDPREWLELDAEAIADRVFTSRADLPEGVSRIPLRTVRANRVPALAPLSALQGVDTARLQLDLPACLRHAELLRAASGIVDTVCRVFEQAATLPAPEDPELGLYGGGFLADRDRALLATVRATPPGQLRGLATAFHDPRYATLLLRYRARNWPETLDADEQATWQAFRRARLTRHTPLTSLTLEEYFSRIRELRGEASAQRQLPLLDQLEAWGEGVAADLGTGVHLEDEA